MLNVAVNDSAAMNMCDGAQQFSHVHANFIHRHVAYVILTVTVHLYIKQMLISLYSLGSRAGGGGADCQGLTALLHMPALIGTETAKRKIFVEDLYSAPPLSAQLTHQFLHCKHNNTPYLPSPRKHLPDGATTSPPLTVIAHVIDKCKGQGV